MNKNDLVTNRALKNIIQEYLGYAGELS